MRSGECELLLQLNCKYFLIRCTNRLGVYGNSFSKPIRKEKNREMSMSPMISVHTCMHVIHILHI